MTCHARFLAAAALVAGLARPPVGAQPAPTETGHAGLEIATVGGGPVHLGDTVDRIRAALAVAPAPQISLGRVQTLWDQTDGIIFHLVDGVATGIDYAAKSRARVQGLDVGIDSTLADMEKALGSSQAGVFPGTRAWPLDAKHQLVAWLNASGTVVRLELGFIPRPAARPSGGVVAWSDPIAASGAVAAAPALAGDARRARLDELLAAHDDVGLLQLLFPQLQKQPAPAREADAIDRAWLQQHAGEARASVLYALSWKLLAFDRDGARAMNARARVEWVLASAQCAQAPEPSPLMFMLEGGGVVDVGPLRRETPAWPAAFERALDWDHALTSPVEPDWYCGPVNVKPASEAAAARQAAWQRARDANHPKTAAER